MLHFAGASFLFAARIDAAGWGSGVGVLRLPLVVAVDKERQQIDGYKVMYDNRNIHLTVLNAFLMK